METKLVPLYVYREYAYCSECGGELKPLSYTSIDGSVFHQCDGCGMKLVFTVAYPRIVYKEVDAMMGDK